MDYEETQKFGEYDNLKTEPLLEFERRIVETPSKPSLNRTASFLLISEGSGVIGVNDYPCRVKKGSLLALMPWQLLEYKEVEHTIKYNQVRYNLDMINKIAKTFRDAQGDNRFLEDLYNNHIVECNELEMDVLIEGFAVLKEELTYNKNFRKAKKKRFSEVYTISKLFEIITIFLRKIHPPENTMRKEKEEHKDEHSLIDVFRYIYSNLGMNLSMDQISKTFFTSRSTLSRFIKKKAGVSFEALVSEMKIRKCLNLLTYTNLSISEVSELLGYADQSHLTNAFQHQMGESPGKYRQGGTDQILLMTENDERLFYHILETVLQNYKNQLSAQVLGKQFGLSASKLNEMFSYHLEKPLPFFLNFVRINRACALMMESDLSILQISEEVGYNNSKTFLRNFTKFKGMTPMEFKKKLKS